jgi:hypothetical protein
MRDWTQEERDLVIDSLHQATRAIDAAMGDVVQYGRELGERGWTIPVEMIPAFTTHLVQSVSPEDTDAVFVEIYSANQGELFDSLAMIITGATDLERWKPLLEQAISAYKRGEYLIVVPALIAAYEGALAGVVDRPHDQRPRALASNELQEVETNLERLAWSSIDAFTSAVFQSATFAGDRPNLLNRHWVLHGRDVPSWTQADCLRLFQALHTLTAARLRKRKDPYEWITNPELRETLRRLDEDE